MKPKVEAWSWQGSLLTEQMYRKSFGCPEEPDKREKMLNGAERRECLINTQLGKCACLLFLLAYRMLPCFGGQEEQRAYATNMKFQK